MLGDGATWRDITAVLNFRVPTRSEGIVSCTVRWVLDNVKSAMKHRKSICVLHVTLLKIPCVKPPSSEVITTVVLESRIEKPLYVDEPHEYSSSSSEIRNNDKALQELICNIDCSAHAENEPGKAISEEAFQLIANKVMLCADVDVHSPSPDFINYQPITAITASTRCWRKNLSQKIMM
ncbi:hypothetical protein L6164_033530 [Bauhinia variegata]|uniref:Uncharacterized protein n=1 Tax=Bauhinia variegata TaxID=167791 RepID=A0ACB9KSV4_BAUVA|nr:hypothetical protein L6164_033530 [Bauhinia variegata]